MDLAVPNEDDADANPETARIIQSRMADVFQCSESVDSRTLCLRVILLFLCVILTQKSFSLILTYLRITR